MPFDPNVLPIPDLGLCCPRCRYVLAGLPQHRCPECGLEFEMEDLLPPGDFPVVIYNGREVAMSDDIAKLLKGAQIPFQRVKSNLDHIYGLTHVDTQGAKLGVPRSCYFEVIHLLQGYDAGQEPEFQPASGGEWPCPKCGEVNPGNFQICWNCREEAPKR
jgi:hypothetical protein